MQKRIPIKNHHREIQMIVHRTIIALVFIALLVSILIGRLAYLQIYKRDLYTTLATNNSLDLLPVEPPRGLIYDRHGILLAENIPVFSLDVTPNDIKNMTQTIDGLKKIVSLSDEDISQFKRQLKQHRRFEEIPLKLRLSEVEVARFAENQHRFPGVQIKARQMRYYPYGDSFSHIMGYVGRINAKELEQIDQANYSASHYIGKTGIEKTYEVALHGQVGYQQVEKDASGQAVRVLKEIKGTPGKNIYLTIDAKLQSIVDKALSDRGAAVVIDPTSGQLLAFVSKPSFDPNPFVHGISHQDYQALQTSKQRPLFNRALRGLYPMASTVKPFYALKALDAGIVTPSDTIYDPGWFELPNYSRRFNDWWHPGHGHVDLNSAIVVSCDTYFYDLALKSGIQRMSTMLTQFGFGKLSGVDLEGEAAGIVASPAWKLAAKRVRWYPGDTVNSGIGQGYMQATPLQLASATATLANRGKRHMPYLLLGEQLPGKPYLQHQPIVLDPVTLSNKQTWETVIHAMQGVVSSPRGTAYRYSRQPFNYTIAAKTGTAQVIAKRNRNGKDIQENLPEQFRDHHLFIAFAPVEQPKIALAIVTENSNTAVETARIIFDYYLGNQNHVNRSPQATAEKATA